MGCLVRPLKTMVLTMVAGFVTMNSRTLKSSAKLRTKKPSLSALLSAKLRASESYTAKGAGVSAKVSPAFDSEMGSFISLKFTGTKHRVSERKSSRLNGSLKGSENA